MHAHHHPTLQKAVIGLFLWGMMLFAGRVVYDKPTFPLLSDLSAAPVETHLPSFALPPLPLPQIVLTPEPQPSDIATTSWQYGQSPDREEDALEVFTESDHELTAQEICFENCRTNAASCLLRGSSDAETLKQCDEAAVGCAEKCGQPQE